MNLVQDRAAVVNRVQKVLEWANLKLSSVATDVMGVSARAMLEAIVEGEVDPAVLADLAQGRMRSKLEVLEQALTGRVRDHHRFLLAQHLLHLDSLDEQIATFETRIASCLQAQSALEDSPPASESSPTTALAEPAPRPVPNQPLPPLAWEEAVVLLDTIPGVGRTTADLIVAEIGTDMQRFGSAAQLASWAKVCPGNHESAGKRYSGKTGTGNRWLRGGLVQAAHAAVKVKESHLAAVYHRLVGRRGVKKAIIAVAHRIVTAVYYMLLHHEPYREPGAPPVDDQRKSRLLNHMLQRLEKLGYHVHLEPIGASTS
jgi:transposase